MTLRLLLPILAAAALPAAEIDLFRAGEGGYHTYRIPALITTRSGTLLAFCEGRRGGAGDTGDIDLLVRRSTDSGKTWSPQRVIADMAGDTVGNPTPVIDRKTGTILLLLTANPGSTTERQIIEGAQPSRTVWIMRSQDDGQSWSAPRDITAQAKRPDWTWYATGPGNGIQLPGGRLVIPCDHNRLDNKARHSHIIYSDDGGESWRIGAVAEEKTNESAIAEARDGSLILNMRSYHGRNRRAVQRSRDRGISLEPLTMDETLIEPICQASLIAAVRPGKRPNGQVLFSNPAATTRRNLTVRLSLDDGRTWPRKLVIHEGPSAYSSLAALRSGDVGLVYERGVKGPYESITFVRFGLKQLTAVNQ